MKKTTTDSEIMSNVLEELNTSANSFAKKLDVTAGTIYHILNGVNSISENLKVRIIKAYPKISYLYLSKGELPICQEESISNSLQNILGDPGGLKKASFEDLPNLLVQMNKKFDTIIELLKKE